MSNQKKASQLGMNPSTASGRLVKDILFRLAVETGHTCYRCGGELIRETFSIEHIKNWLDSEDPVGLYFDQDNIAFSHLACNVTARRKPYKPTADEIPHGILNRYNHHGCRCSLCKEVKSKYLKKVYVPEERQERYQRTGQ